MGVMHSLTEDKHGVIADKAGYTFVVVKEFSIQIIKTDDGVIIDVYAKGCEHCGCIAGTYCFDNDAKEVQEDDAKVGFHKKEATDEQE